MCVISVSNCCCPIPLPTAKARSVFSRADSFPASSTVFFHGAGYASSSAPTGAVRSWPFFFKCGYPQQNTSSYTQYGVVQSIALVPQNSTSGIGAGTIAGAVVGGILGHQIGDGTGNTAATVLGAAGGAYAGHELEKRNQAQQGNVYQLTVRLNNGTYQTLTQTTNNDIRVGDSVRIDNGVAQRY